ncbi:MAG: hypothetical protein M3N38_11360 [Pseudomonadota bacterium]|nr:hypothetical protein [Pseudomonadota bacterium]
MAKAKQFNISVASKPGTVADAIRALAAAKVNVTSILGWNPSGALQLVLDNPKAAKKALDAAGISHTESAAEVVKLANKPGALLKYLDKLAKNGTNLRTICATANKKGTNATVVWTPES